MIGDYHIRVFWPARSDSPERLGYQSFLFLTALKGVSSALDGFRVAGAGARPLPGGAGSADSAPACTEAALRATVRWKCGKELRTSYTPSFVLERDGARIALLSLTMGIEPPGVGPVFVPNRLDIAVSAAALDPRTGPATLENVLRAAVAVFRPQWGHAGAASHPVAPLAFFSDGAPSVGWMTYLSTAYPALPAPLPSPAVAYPVASFGTLLVAHPQIFDPRDPAHAGAVAALRAALRAAGVLLPFVDVAGRRVSV